MEVTLEQNLKTKHDRRSFLKTAGLSGGVLALGPLAASLVTSSEVSAAPVDGKYDFDKPYNRIGFDDIKWDAAVREDHMSHIVAGMGIADMDFRCAPAITAALKKRMLHEEWGYIDMGSPGPMAFKQGLIDWNRKRYGITVMNHENMGITTGVHAGIMATLRAYAPQGTKVLMATPIYNGFYYDIMGSKLVRNESLMHYANGRYEIDWDDLERRMTPDTKVTILCNPQNPVGRAWTKEELNRYGELALKHNVKVLSDEIHCDFITKGSKYTPFSTLDNKEVVANSITFKSGSKSFSLAGMKCAWFFTTNPEMFKEVSFWNRADLSTLGMIAEQSAYAGGEDWLNECVDYIDGNQEFANQYIKANVPLIKVGRKPEGTYLSWLDVSAVVDKIGAQKMADVENKRPQPISMLTNKPNVVTPEDMIGHWFAKNAYVAIEAGSSFGYGGQNHMRMNVATSRRTLTAALDSMAGALKNLA
jgi:cystathionine beta-lyase